MLSLGYAIPAVAAGFVGRYIPLGGTVLDAGGGTGLFGSILRVLGYEECVGIDISGCMLEKAGEKDAYRRLHRMVLGEPLGFEEKQALLEKAGRWQRVTMSDTFQPFPYGNVSHKNRLFVYKTG